MSTVLNYRDEITVWHEGEAVFATVLNPPGAYRTDRRFGYVVTVAQDGYEHGLSYTYDEGRTWLSGWSEENKAILGATTALDTETTQPQAPGGFFGSGPNPPEVAHWIIAPRRT